MFVAAFLAGPITAFGAPRELRLTLEPGAAGLSLPQENRTWGWVGGASVGVGLTAQTWVMVYAGRAGFPGHDLTLTGTTAAVTLVYHLDVLDISPYLGIGLAWSAITTADGTVIQRETLATLEAGFDIAMPGVGDWLLWGVIVRYYPLFDSDLLGHPAYATVHGRIGVVFSDFN